MTKPSQPNRHGFFKIVRLTAATTVLACVSFSSAFAEPPVPPFYEAVMKMTPVGKLGEVIKKRANSNLAQRCAGVEDCLYFIRCR